jgi:cell division protein FtsW (lipid II flippase)
MPLMVITFLALAAPLIIGSWQNGAKNWLKFGDGDALTVQPSSLASCR